MQIKALDRDEGDNANIFYTLNPGQDQTVARLFDVNGTTGLVTTKASLMEAGRLQGSKRDIPQSCENLLV